MSELKGLTGKLSEGFKFYGKIEFDLSLGIGNPPNVAAPDKDYTFPSIEFSNLEETVDVRPNLEPFRFMASL